jgi:hypothetical protein
MVAPTPVNPWAETAAEVAVSNAFVSILAAFSNGNAAVAAATVDGSDPWVKSEPLELIESGTIESKEHAAMDEIKVTLVSVRLNQFKRLRLDPRIRAVYGCCGYCRIAI